MDASPDPAPFICVGQMKAGTTWLYSALEASTGYFVPPVKEWNYLSFLSEFGDVTFNELIGSPRFDGYRRTYFREALNTFAFQFSNLIGHDITPAILDHLAWWRSYLFCDRDVDAFVGLIAPRNSRPSFDVSPSYALVDEGVLRRLNRAIPGLKIVFLLRDPLSRFVSHLTMFQETGELVRATELEWLHVCDQTQISKAIARYVSIFGADRMFIGFTEEVRAAPEQFLRALGKFLNATMPEIAPPPANVSERRSIDFPAYAGAIPTCLAEIESLRGWVDDVVLNRWRARAREGVLDSQAWSEGSLPWQSLMSGPLNQTSSS